MNKRNHGLVVLSVALALAALVALTACTLKELEIWAEATRNASFPVSAAPAVVEAISSNGTIPIRGMEGVEQMSVTATLHSRGDTIEEATVDAETSNGAIFFSGRILPDTHRMRTSNEAIQVTIPRDLAILINADTSNGSITSSLGLVGDTKGNSWSALLNPPIKSTLTLKTSNGVISMDGLP
ncbi:MAG: hypothetical protein U9Q94_02250 [Candidatus Bipolaricaulota bacterium]|nr:hypothetical protein [Candidatus Bipolaricaulota bacterium]